MSHQNGFPRHVFIFFCSFWPLYSTKGVELWPVLINISGQNVYLYDKKWRLLQTIQSESLILCTMGNHKSQQPKKNPPNKDGCLKKSTQKRPVSKNIYTIRTQYWHMTWWKMDILPSFETLSDVGLKPTYIIYQKVFKCIQIHPNTSKYIKNIPNT